VPGARGIHFTVPAGEQSGSAWPWLRQVLLALQLAMAGSLHRHREGSPTSDPVCKMELRWFTRQACRDFLIHYSSLLPPLPLGSGLNRSPVVSSHRYLHSCLLDNPSLSSTTHLWAA
jgi:hypothetical protein